MGVPADRMETVPDSAKSPTERQRANESSRRLGYRQGPVVKYEDGNAGVNEHHA